MKILLSVASGKQRALGRGEGNWPGRKSNRSVCSVMSSLPIGTSSRHCRPHEELRRLAAGQTDWFQGESHRIYPHKRGNHQGSGLAEFLLRRELKMGWGACSRCPHAKCEAFTRGFSQAATAISALHTGKPSHEPVLPFEEVVREGARDQCTTVCTWWATDTPDFPVLEQGPGSGLEQSWFALDWSLGQLSEAISECSEGEQGLSDCLLLLGSHLVWHAASFLHPEHGYLQAWKLLPLSGVSSA